MTTFFCRPALDFNEKKIQFTIATSPIVLNTAGDKVLLHKGESTAKWQFIGGRYDDTMTFRESALSHGQAILGAGNTLTLLDAENPIVVLDTIDLKGYEEQTLLIHYTASISNEEQVGEAAWFSLQEVRMLDAKNETSSENVKMLSEQLLTQ